jgi:hypothetical protein
VKESAIDLNEVDALFASKQTVAKVADKPVDKKPSVKIFGVISPLMPLDRENP